MRAKSDYVDVSLVKSFKTILEELTKLEKRLSNDRLNQFIVFNKAYFIVTSALRQSADKGYFENPVFVEKFTVRFAKYYFQAVNQTVAGSPKLPPAWTMVNQAGKRKNTPNFILLLMGANAHINNDLPLVLLELVDEAHAGNLFKDILKVDKLLMKSGKEIIRAFEEPDKRLNWLKRRFVFVYYRPVMYMILFWRVGTWRDYKSMLKAGTTANGYDKRSMRIARRFQKLAKHI